MDCCRSCTPGRLAAAACLVCANVCGLSGGLTYPEQILPIVLECARCFLPCSHLMAVTEQVMPGLFPCLADLWHVAYTSQTLGLPASLDTQPGLLLFTVEAPQPYWPAAVVSIGDPEVAEGWRVSLANAAQRQQEGRTRLLARRDIAPPDTPQTIAQLPPACSPHSRAASLCRLATWVDCWLQPPLPRALQLVPVRNSSSMSAHRSGMLGTQISCSRPLRFSLPHVSYPSRAGVPWCVTPPCLSIRRRSLLGACRLWPIVHGLGLVPLSPDSCRLGPTLAFVRPWAAASLACSVSTFRCLMS